jgi:hypothetical protein
MERVVQFEDFHGKGLLSEKNGGLILSLDCVKLAYKPIIAKKGSFRKQKSENST